MARRMSRSKGCLDPLVDSREFPVPLFQPEPEVIEGRQLQLGVDLDLLVQQGIYCRADIFQVRCVYVNSGQFGQWTAAKICAE